MNFLVQLMRTARKVFGHIIPAPELIHTAIWVGKNGANDDSIGAIFVYGKYWNKLNMSTYLFGDGAKAYMMKLNEFKERYPSTNPVKLNSKRKLKLYDFIEKVENGLPKTIIGQIKIASILRLN